MLMIILLFTVAAAAAVDVAHLFSIK